MDPNGRVVRANLLCARHEGVVVRALRVLAHRVRRPPSSRRTTAHLSAHERPPLRLVRRRARHIGLRRKVRLVLKPPPRDAQPFRPQVLHVAHDAVRKAREKRRRKRGERSTVIAVVALPPRRRGPVLGRPPVDTARILERFELRHLRRPAPHNALVVGRPAEEEPEREAYCPHTLDDLGGEACAFTWREIVRRADGGGVSVRNKLAVHRHPIVVRPD